MKTIEVQVTFTTQVSDEIACKINSDPKSFFVVFEGHNPILRPFFNSKGENKIPLESFETTNVEVLEG